MNIVKNIIIPSIITSLLIVIYMHNFSFKGCPPLTKEEIPASLFSSFIGALVFWGIKYIVSKK